MIQAALDGKLTNQEGADSLRISRSQFKRLRRKVGGDGVKGVLHGNRGRTSPRRLSDRLREAVVELLTGEVKLNDHHIWPSTAGHHDADGATPSRLRGPKRTTRSTFLPFDAGRWTLDSSRPCQEARLRPSGR